MPEAFTPIVFVVDDDPSVRTAVKRLLASVGLPCETFSTAMEFLARSERGVSGCVVLDVRMPGASGLDLQDQLAAGGYTLPVIFVSAHADVALTVRVMRKGALQVFTKPFDDQARDGRPQRRIVVHDEDGRFVCHAPAEKRVLNVLGRRDLARGSYLAVGCGA